MHSIEKYTKREHCTCLCNGRLSNACTKINKEILPNSLSSTANFFLFVRGEKSRARTKREDGESDRGKRGKEWQGKFWASWHVCYTRLNTHKQKTNQQANININKQTKHSNRRKKLQGYWALLAGVVVIGLFSVFQQKRQGKKQRERKRGAGDEWCPCMLSMEKNVDTENYSFFKERPKDAKSVSKLSEQLGTLSCLYSFLPSLPPLVVTKQQQKDRRLMIRYIHSGLPFILFFPRKNRTGVRKAGV